MPRNSFKHLEFVPLYIKTEEIHPSLSMGQQNRIKWETLDVRQFAFFQFRLSHFTSNDFTSDLSFIERNLFLGIEVNMIINTALSVIKMLYDSTSVGYFSRLRQFWSVQDFRLRLAKFLCEVGSGSTSNPVQFISFSKKSVLEKDSPSAAPLSMKNPLVYISI